MKRLLSSFSIAAILALGTAFAAHANESKTHEDMVKKMDSDNNGTITRQEYMRFHEDKWRKIDKNNAGSISTTDLKTMHKDMGYKNKQMSKDGMKDRDKRDGTDSSQY